MLSEHKKQLSGVYGDPIQTQNQKVKPKLGRGREIKKRHEQWIQDENQFIDDEMMKEDENPGFLVEDDFKKMSMDK